MVFCSVPNISNIIKGLSRYVYCTANLQPYFFPIIFNFRDLNLAAVYEIK